MDSTDLTAYLCVFAALVAAGVGFPMPEELPIVAAGAMTGHAAQDPDSWLRWWLFLPVCILGVVISDGLLYLMGRIFGLGLLKFPFVARLLPLERLQRIQRNFRRYGVLILLFARLLPGIRSPIFLTAGIMRLSWRRFLLADGLYAIPGVSLLFFLAYWFTDQFREAVERAETYLDRIRPLLIVAAILGIGIYFVVQFLRKPVHTGDPEELPLIGDQVAASIEDHDQAAAGEANDERAEPGRNGWEGTTPEPVEKAPSSQKS